MVMKCALVRRQSGAVCREVHSLGCLLSMTGGGPDWAPQSVVLMENPSYPSLRKVGKMKRMSDNRTDLSVNLHIAAC